MTTFHGPNFTIDLPGVPTETTRRVQSAGGEITVFLYLVVSGDAAVGIAVDEQPDGVPVNLDGAVEGAASNINGTVVSSKPITVDSHQGREGRISSEQGNAHYTVFFHMVAVGQQLVQIQQSVKGKELTSPPGSYQQIVRSLVLT